MDEIFIEEKKFVSSKQAAKMTGYAKDYIGQLCREGRVPARLIGRNWFVLEAAIQDHKFGNPEDIEPVKKEEKAVESPSPISTWESPRYESSEEELLPSVNRIKDVLPSDDQEEGNEATQHIQDSWKAWFDRFDHSEDVDTGNAEDTDERGTEVAVNTVVEQEDKPEELEEVEAEEKEEKAETEDEVQVPIHTVPRPFYQLPPEELLPRHLTASTPREVTIPKNKKSKRGVLMTIQTIGAVIAIAVATTAVIGSGYFDGYIISNSQARIIAGVALYNK